MSELDELIENRIYEVTINFIDTQDNNVYKVTTSSILECVNTFVEIATNDNLQLLPNEDNTTVEETILRLASSYLPSTFPLKRNEGEILKNKESIKICNEKINAIENDLKEMECLKNTVTDSRHKETTLKESISHMKKQLFEINGLEIDLIDMCILNIDLEIKNEHYSLKLSRNKLIHYIRSVKDYATQESKLHEILLEQEQKTHEIEKYLEDSKNKFKAINTITEFINCLGHQLREIENKSNNDNLQDLVQKIKHHLKEEDDLLKFVSQYREELSELQKIKSTLLEKHCRMVEQLLPCQTPMHVENGNKQSALETLTSNNSPLTNTDGYENLQRLIASLKSNEKIKERMILHILETRESLINIKKDKELQQQLYNIKRKIKRLEGKNRLMCSPRPKYLIQRSKRYNQKLYSTLQTLQDFFKVHAVPYLHALEYGDADIERFLDFGPEIPSGSSGYDIFCRMYYMFKTREYEFSILPLSDILKYKSICSYAEPLASQNYSENHSETMQQALYVAKKYKTPLGHKEEIRIAEDITIVENPTPSQTSSGRSSESGTERPVPATNVSDAQTSEISDTPLDLYAISQYEKVESWLEEIYGNKTSEVVRFNNYEKVKYDARNKVYRQPEFKSHSQHKNILSHAESAASQNSKNHSEKMQQALCIAKKYTTLGHKKKTPLTEGVTYISDEDESRIPPSTLPDLTSHEVRRSEETQHIDANISDVEIAQSTSNNFSKII